MDNYYPLKHSHPRSSNKSHLLKSHSPRQCNDWDTLHALKCNDTEQKTHVAETHVGSQGIIGFAFRQPINQGRHNSNASLQALRHRVNHTWV